MTKSQKIIATMPTATDINDNVITPPVFISEDGRIVLSAEDETSFYFADYYGEFRGGYPWVNPKLESWAKERGCFWEWINPGALTLVKA